MADEIINTLGFDATQAVNELQRLDGLLQGFENRLNGLTVAMRNWNGMAGRTVSAMKQISSNTLDAANAVERLQRALRGGTGQQTTQSQPQPQPGPQQQPQPVPNNVTNSLIQADKLTRQWTISWQTLSRVVATQLIVRAMSQLRDVMNGAVAANIEYARSLNRVRTIAEEENASGRRRIQTISQLSQVTREMSDQLNMPLIDVSQGLYDVISQQIKGADAQRRVLESSVQFAFVTGESTADSVQLLTSTMHAFGKAEAEIDTIASKFFRTMDIGNVKARDFIVSFGRVAPMAKEVGVSLDEAQAAYALLTQKGVRAEEAATQIAASFTAFLKPSQDMAKAFREIGVASGDEAFRAYGYIGALEKVISTTDGTSASLAKLFRNVRALRDVMSLAREDAGKYKDILAEIQTTAPTEIKSQYGQIMETDAERVSAAMNQIKNAVTVDIGGALVGGLSGIIDVVGVENAITAIKGLTIALTVSTVIIGGVSAALLIYVANAKLAAISTGVYSTSMFTGLVPSITAATTSLAAYLPASAQAVVANKAAAASAWAAAGGFQSLGVAMISTLALVAGAVVGGRMIGSKLDGMLQASQSRLADFNRQSLEDLKAVEQQKVTEYGRTVDEQVRLASELTARLRREMFRQLDTEKEKNRELVDNTKSVMDRVIDIRERAAQRYRQTALEADRQAESSVVRQAETAAQLDDQRFRFRVKDLDVSRQVYSLSARANELAVKAASAMADAKTRKEYDVASDLFRRAQATAQEAASSAQSSENTRDRFVAEQAIEGVLRRQLSAEQQYQSVQQQLSATSAARAAEEGKRVEELKRLRQAAIENMLLFDRKTGDPLSGEKRAQQLAKAQASLRDFFRTAFAGTEGRVDAEQLLEFDRLQQRLKTEMEAGVTKAEISNLTIAPQALEEMNSRISEGVGIVDVAVRLVPDKAMLPADFDQLTQVEKLQQVDEAIRKSAADLKESRQRATQSYLDVEGARRLRTEIEETLKSSQSLGAKTLQALKSPIDTARGITAPGAVDPGPLGEEILNLERARDIIRSLANDANLTEDMWRSAASTILADFEKSPQVKIKEWEGVALALQTLLTLARQADQTRVESFTEPLDTGAGLQHLQSGVQGAQEALNGLDQTSQRAGQSLDQMRPPVDASSSINSITASVDLLSQHIGMAINQFNNLGAAAANAAASANSTAAVQTAAHGGFASRYLAAGGAIGTDVVPAMLSPGEFVMNAASVQRFASQLVAMNAGVKPVFRSEGGSITNIGDINVTVGGGGTATKTGRTIAAEIRRELRRRSSTL